MAPPPNRPLPPIAAIGYPRGTPARQRIGARPPRARNGARPIGRGLPNPRGPHWPLAGGARLAANRLRTAPGGTPPHPPAEGRREALWAGRGQARPRAHSLAQLRPPRAHDSSRAAAEPRGRGGRHAPRTSAADPGRRARGEGGPSGKGRAGAVAALPLSKMAAATSARSPRSLLRRLRRPPSKMAVSPGEGRGRAGRGQGAPAARTPARGRGTRRASGGTGGTSRAAPGGRAGRRAVTQRRGAPGRAAGGSGSAPPPPASRPRSGGDPTGPGSRGGPAGRPRGRAGLASRPRGPEGRAGAGFLRGREKCQSARAGRAERSAPPGRARAAARFGPRACRERARRPGRPRSAAICSVESEAPLDVINVNKRAVTL